MNDSQLYIRWNKTARLLTYLNVVIDNDVWCRDFSSAMLISSSIIHRFLLEIYSFLSCSALRLFRPVCSAVDHWNLFENFTKNSRFIQMISEKYLNQIPPLIRGKAVETAAK